MARISHKIFWAYFSYVFAIECEFLHFDQSLYTICGVESLHPLALSCFLPGAMILTIKKDASRINDKGLCSGFLIG